MFSVAEIIIWIVLCNAVSVLLRGNSVLASSRINVYLRGTAETEVDNSSLYWLVCDYLLLYIYSVLERKSGKGETEWWRERDRTNFNENINLNFREINLFWEVSFYSYLF